MQVAHRRSYQCPRCKTPISEMSHAVKRQYVYYHCTKSGNPDCAERGIEPKGSNVSSSPTCSKSEYRPAVRLRCKRSRSRPGRTFKGSFVKCFTLLIFHVLHEKPHKKSGFAKLYFAQLTL